MASTQHDVQEKWPNTYKCKWCGLFTSCLHNNNQGYDCFDGEPLEADPLTLEMTDPHNHEKQLLIKFNRNNIIKALVLHKPSLYATTIEAYAQKLGLPKPGTAEMSEWLIKWNKLKDAEKG